MLNLKLDDMAVRADPPLYATTKKKMEEFLVESRGMIEEFDH
jgi:hypothetical protein